MIERWRQELGRPVVVGHRGAMAEAPENTLASFQRAVELGADVVELDVHASADGVPVVIHDDTLERTTDGQGPVARLPLAALRALDAGSWFGPQFAGERVPTLDEALEWSRGRVPLAVEIKGSPCPTPDLVDAVVRALQRHAALERAIVIAFDHPALRLARELEPRLHCGVLYECRPVDAPALAKAAGAEALLPHWSFVTPEDVQAAHEAGLALQPWETSDPVVLERLFAAGVDGVASNRPDVARQVLARWQRG